MSNSKPSVPKQWPPEVVEIYDPIRSLGQGGFGSVMLARKKKAASDDPHKLVAMKVVGGSKFTPQEVGYAHREIDILKELDHKNIMRVVEYWEPPAELEACAAVMALSYAKGPTLEYLLKLGGALSPAFGRVIGAQLVDVIAYLHTRAVIHRDIKPDNIVVTGASKDQAEIWDDIISEKDADWAALRQKWHLTLVDFGFARALTPEDMKKPPPKMSRRDTSTSLDSSSNMSRSGRRRSSLSRRFHRTMSAVGNRNYAAPEIIKGVHMEDGSVSSRFDGIDITRTISKNVSEYSMTADAFSLGNTLKYMMTGVPPHENVNEAIAAQNHPIVLLCSLLCSSKKKGQTEQRKVVYRNFSKINPEAVRLIRGMTHYDPQQRTSVRTARLYPWVDDALEDAEFSATKVEYLSFALTNQNGDLKDDVAVHEKESEDKTQAVEAS